MLFFLCITLGLASFSYAVPVCLSSTKYTAKVKQTSITLARGATVPDVYDVSACILLYTLYFTIYMHIYTPL